MKIIVEDRLAAGLQVVIILKWKQDQDVFALSDR
jgi:hypothetical protein